jgi:hypothetical protein
MMAGRRPLTAADALASWQVDAELSGGHTVAETLAFVAALEGVEENSRPLPPGVITFDAEPRVISFLRRLFGRE